MAACPRESEREEDDPEGGSTEGGGGEKSFVVTLTRILAPDEGPPALGPHLVPVITKSFISHVPS